MEALLLWSKVFLSPNEDLQSICDFKTTDAGPMEAIVSHYRDNYEIFTKDDEKVIVSQVNALPSEEGEYGYFDHYTKKLYKVSHHPVEIKKVEDYECEDDEFINSIGAAIEKYLEEFFGEQSSFIIVKKDGGYEIVYTSKINNKSSR